MRATTRRRQGFSLFGLLVLLAILGLLLALLLPAIQRVREAANRMTCASNLRQLAIAAHNWHNDYQKLPPGYLGPMTENGLLDEKHQNVSCLTMMLPYMEQDNLFKQLQIDMAVRNAGDAWWKDARANQNNLTWSATRIKMFRCPSDAAEANLTEGVVAAFHNVGLTMDSKILPKPNASTPAWTNYTGVAGCLGKVPAKDKDAEFFNVFDGTLGNRTVVTLGQLATQDGTSNTLMFGEGLGGVVTGPRDRAWSWMGVGAMVTYYGLAKAPPVENPSTAHYRFGSRHANVTQFAFGDGSTRGIRFGETAKIPAKLAADKATDWVLLQQLAGRKDGLNFDVSAIVD